MQQSVFDDIIKLQNKGVLTIPKKFRMDFLEENGLVRIIKEKGRLIIEPVRTLPYPVRRYTDKEVEEFIKMDRHEK